MFHGKTLVNENVYICNDHFTEYCYEVSYRHELLDAKTRKRNSGSVLLQFLAPLGLNKPLKFFVCSDIGILFVSLPRSNIKIQTTGVKYNCLRLY